MAPYHDVVDTLYATVVSPSQWPRALEVLADALQAPCARLRSVGPTPAFDVRVGSQRALAGHYHHVDRAIDIDAAASCDNGEQIAVADPRVCVGLVAAGGPALPKIVCTVYRPPQAPAFDDRGRRLFQRLIEHFARALDIGATVADARRRATASMCVLDLAPQGIILVDAAGRALHCNARARAVIASGSRVVLSDGLVDFSDAADRAAFRAAFRALLADNCATTAQAMLRTGGRTSDLFVQIVRLPPARIDPGWPTETVALLRFIEPAAATVNAGLLQKAFALTPAEARVAAALLRESGVAAIARSLGMADNTVKFHLKALFAKTGAPTQVELVRRLTALLPFLH